MILLAKGSNRSKEKIIVKTKTQAKVKKKKVIAISKGNRGKRTRTSALTHIKIKQQHSTVHKNMIYPNTDKLPPKKWKIAERKRQNKILKEYRENNVIPFMYPFRARDYVPLDYFEKNLEEADIISEKDLPKLPRGKKRREQLLKQKPFLNITGKKIGKTAGNQIQTQMFTYKDWDTIGKRKQFIGRFAGLFTQPKGKPISRDVIGTDHGIPAPTLYKPRVNKKGKVTGEIWVDNDDAGHNIAYILNMYAFKNPFIKNVRFALSKELKAPDLIKANRFMAISLLNTLGTRQSDALIDALTDEKTGLGEDSLKYRREGTVTNLKPSEPLLQISNRVYKSMEKAEFDVLLIGKRITFDGEDDTGIPIKEIKRRKPPVLIFEPYPETKERVRRLDSDMLLRVLVERHQLEPDSAQNLMESLHNQGWITYPRTKTETAQEEPIRLLRPVDKDKQFNRRFDRETMQRYKKGFEGTTQEKNILDLVKQAEKSYPKENFIQDGEWVLKSGKFEAREDGLLIAGEQAKFSDKEFDIEIAKRGITPERLTNYLTTERIGTPATRTAELSRLKQAGIISLKEGRYILDQRGLYLVATLRVLEEENVPTAKQLTVKIRKAKNVKQMVAIINKFKLIPRDYLKNRISEEARLLVRAESDLTYLDSF